MTAQNPVTETKEFTPLATSVTAYEECKAEIEEAAKHPVVALNADVPYAVRVMLTVVGNTQLYMPELKKLGIVEAEKLALRANALSYAQALHDWTLSSPPKIDALAEQVFAARRLVKSELDLMVVRGRIAEGAVKVQTTNSYLGTAQDVRAICSAFLANWDQVGPQIGNDMAHVHEALRSADNLIAALAKGAEIQEKLKGTALMRAAAWTLALKCFNQVYRGIQFIRFDEGDVDEIVPSIFDHGNRPKKKKPGEKPTDGASDSQPPPPPVNGNGGSASPNTPSSPILPSKPFE